MNEPADFEPIVDRDLPEFVLGIDGRPWGTRAVLARSPEATGQQGEILKSFEVAEATTFWQRIASVVTEAEDTIGRSSVAVRVASLPNRSHAYEVAKLQRHLPAGSTVAVLPVEEEYARRPRLQGSDAIAERSAEVSALLAVGVARLNTPGDSLEIGPEHLAELAGNNASSPSTSADTPADVAEDEPYGVKGSHRLLVAAAAAVLVLLGATGILGLNAEPEPVQDPSTTSVVERVEEDQPATSTTVSEARPLPSTSLTSTTVPATTTTSTVPPTTTTAAPAVTTTVPRGIDLSGIGAHDIDFSGIEFDQPETTVPEVSSERGSVDLGFLPEESQPASIDLSGLPQAD